MKEETPVVPKKTCHACGQQIPIKIGDTVEGARYVGLPKFQGTVYHILGDHAKVVTFAGLLTTLPVSTLTRLHGYYRITERETMA